MRFEEKFDERDDYKRVLEDFKNYYQYMYDNSSSLNKVEKFNGRRRLLHSQHGSKNCTL